LQETIGHQKSTPEVELPLILRMRSENNDVNSQFQGLGFAFGEV